jgi:protein-tyrosine phosphatase
MDILPERVIRLDGAHNVRDLGGYAITGGGETRWRRLLRADNLTALTDADVEALEALGVRTVIDLRGDAELALEPSPYADGSRLSYINIPLYDEMAPIVTAGMSFDMGARYATALERCGDRIAEVLDAIAAAAPGGVLFHCTAGKDRTGVIAALLLTLSGVAPETVIADYMLTAKATALLARLRARALERGTPVDQVELVLASDASSMHTMLVALETLHGGVDAYLPSIGVSAETIGQLRQRLVADAA